MVGLIAEGLNMRLPLHCSSLIIFWLVAIAPSIGQGQPITENPEAFKLLEEANRLVEAKKWEEADQVFSKAEQLDPGSYQIAEVRTLSLTLQAIAKYEKRDWDGSLNAWSKVIERQPKNASNFRLRAAVWVEKEEYAKAVEDLSTAIRISPEHPNGYRLRAAAFCLLERNKEALADFRSYDRLKPRDPTANAAIVWILATCPDHTVRDGAAALKHAENYVAANPDSMDRLARSKAAAYAELGQFEKAVECQQAALSSSPAGTDNHEFNALLLKQYSMKKTFHTTTVPLWRQ
jgi:tetratricopeptide (TPR) repeat protein